MCGTFVQRERESAWPLRSQSMAIRPRRRFTFLRARELVRAGVTSGRDLFTFSSRLSVCACVCVCVLIERDQHIVLLAE